MGDFGELAVHGVLSWDGRDNRVFPRKGVFAAARGTYFPEVWDVTSDFGEVNGNVNAYLSAGQVVTLALRAGGKKVFGRLPLHRGGLHRRGRPGRRAPRRARRTRCAATGPAATWATPRPVGQRRPPAPHLAHHDHPARPWGIHGFADAGRVWLEGETSDTWHAGVGGGIWISPLNDRMAFSTGISHSKETNLFYFNGGFSY